MRETAIRDVEGFSDPLVLQALAFRVRTACRTAAEHGGAVQDRWALQRASRFLHHAKGGVVIRQHGRLSATPTLDLLIEEYTREAMVKINAAAGNGEFSTSLEALIEAFDRAAAGGKLKAKAPWTLAEFDLLWSHLFHIAAGAAADPTDIRLPDRSQSL